MKQMFMTVGTTVNRQRDQLLRVGRITNHHDIHFGTCVGLLYRTNAHTTKLEKKTFIGIPLKRFAFLDMFDHQGN